MMNSYDPETESTGTAEVATPEAPAEEVAA